MPIRSNLIALMTTSFTLAFCRVNTLTGNRPDAIEAREQISNQGRATLELQAPNITSKWIWDSAYVQIIEVWVENTAQTAYITESDHVEIFVNSDSLDTIVPGTLKRLAPKQSSMVQVGVKNKAGVDPGSPCGGSIVVSYGRSRQTAKQTLSGRCGIGDYVATADSLNPHLAPDWFTGAKYGIFIHWGLYSAPGYGGAGANEDYAEWYWAWMNDNTSATGTYQYHLDTYGKDFNYDDFTSNFTDAAFDPKEWVDLIADAGAKYFVPTTKHHDGFALFNFSESISRRSSVHYGPKRDLLKDLFAAAREYQPHLRRGTYFSMPEFYNPAWKKYAYSSWPGGPPKNPYTGEVIPYTGYVEVDDFVEDIQLPQMNVLAYEYDTDIMWCDISYVAQNATIFASDWLNWARDKNRQVTYNSRCGPSSGLIGDYNTSAEYNNYDGPVYKKWETSRGMDPYSFGYNYLTPDSAYLTGEEIVTSLVDIVSKNGNLLLDIGPMHNGSIPQIMQTNLRVAGKWINAHGESIFNTYYWTVKQGNGPVRYTTTDDAFYVHHNGTPPAELSISDPVPYLTGDDVTVVGGTQSGKKVPVTWGGIGNLTLHLDDDVIAGDEFVWTFKIQYN